MAGKAKSKAVENDLGCGFMGRIFQLGNYKLRKSSVHSLPMRPPSQESKSNHHPTPSAHRNNQNRRPSDAARSSTSSCGNSTQTKTQQSHNLNYDSKTGNSPELAWISTHHLRDNENKSPLKITGNLLVNNSPRTNTKIVESVPKSKDMNFVPSSYNNAGIGVMGNIRRRNSDELAQSRSPRNKVDPEALKTMGNEAYKQGRFEEALALYDRAIAIDSNKATYHCNKSAALIGLGRLLEAVVECQEAIRLEPSYSRPHHRLATIYLRYSIN